MKFEINRDILSEGLAKVSQVLATSTPLPILQGILLEVEQDSISLTTSDNTQSIQHTIPVDGDAVKVFESGKTVLPKTAVKLVKKSKKVLTFTLDNFLTTITSGKSVFELNCLDPEEYPKLPQIDDSKANLTLNGKQFADFVKKTAFAASTSETRPILQGVLVDIQKDCITLSSTDSHRLGKVTCKWSNQEEIRIVVPAKFLDKAATKIFEPDSDVELFAHEQMILLRNDQTVYYTRLLDGNYPDTSRLLPTEFISVMNIDRKEFLDALDLVNEVSKTADNNNEGVVKLHVNGAATISSQQAQTGKGQIEIPYSSLEGEDDYDIAFSCKYAIDALKALHCDEVSFRFTGPMRPFLITPVEDTEVEERQLILPVRTI